MDRPRYWQQKYYYLVSATISQSAADATMGDKLKRDLQNLQRKKAPVTSTPMSDDSDNTDIDLFENTELRQSRKRAALESDNEQEDNVSKEFENSLLQRTSPQNSPVMLDDDVVKALKDTVIKEFPKTTVSEVRALIRRKCNNESTSKNSHSPLEG
ncbi:hypothetical protein ROHU_013030 [Labeo rohita]|uniref:Uncharacterized protein n=1 Tax=Labeo rohita TaxID=84645 RepID=A0A498LET8_LABRO|nr:hypothetical protein ROHU_013030 [Labeo rohita]